MLLRKVDNMFKFLGTRLKSNRDSLDLFSSIKKSHHNLCVNECHFPLTKTQTKVQKIARTQSIHGLLILEVSVEVHGPIYNHSIRYVQHFQMIQELILYQVIIVFAVSPPFGLGNPILDLRFPITRALLQLFFLVYF